uniref:Extracellular serine-rich protein n=1 Tax=Pyricularia oryzae (strain 70-15 / ATCC MYA-4617 / FGSC 8958) TaxID=242507 RepID=Q2KFS6_PYRO7|nr:hypothetical protein MGCH7_ch7g609 [Pyricularia oryzae 70-15]
MATDPCPLRRFTSQFTVVGGFVLFWLTQRCMAEPLLGVRRSVQSIITVGKNGREFVPNITSAWAGDVIEFHFYPGNYSVVRSAYMFPCVPFENTGTGRQGFWSGFIDNKSPSPAKWRLTLPDSNAVFFYSSAGDDCNRYAMVAGINIMEDQLQMQHDMALDSPSVVQPSSASHPTVDNVPSTPSFSDPQAAKQEVPIGIIVGGVLGGVAVLAIIGAILYLCGSRSRKQRASQPGRGGSRSPTMQATRDDSGGGQGSGGSSSAGKASIAGSGHRQHQYDARIARNSSSTYLPTRGAGGTADGWQLEDGQISILSNSHHHHQQHAAALPSPPIIDGDTIYVPVHRSTINVGRPVAEPLHATEVTTAAKLAGEHGGADAPPAMAGAGADRRQRCRERRVWHRRQEVPEHPIGGADIFSCADDRSLCSTIPATATSRRSRAEVRRRTPGPGAARTSLAACRRDPGERLA